MKANTVVTAALSALGAAIVLAQTPAPRQGPGVQALQDSREPAVLTACKTPPPPAAPPALAPQAPLPAGAAAGNAEREYTVTAIPGVIAAGQRWTTVWKDDGNNADGIVGTEDGGLLIARNDKSDVVKLDKSGKDSVFYQNTNTGGALSFNAKGGLFINERALNPAIWQLAPTRKLFANKYQGDPLDCIGIVLNDLTADSKGGVYFTMGGVFYADAKGVITKYGENLRTNGIILSPDEKTLYVTNAGTVAAFDVQPGGALSNQRTFATLPGGGGDGSTVDAAGRIYVTATAGVHVLAPDGKSLGVIPAPVGVIGVAFSGPEKKTLYAVGVIRNGDSRSVQILAMPTLAQGYKGRAK